MSHNEKREKRRLEMNRVDNEARSSHHKPVSPDVPDEFRRFARCLAETEAPPDEILTSGQRGPELLDRVYCDLERILDVVGGFDKKRAELEKEIKIKEGENRQNVDNHEDDKVILTDHIGLMTSQEDNSPFKKIPKEPHPSPSRRLHPLREDLFESAQKGVYLPADAFIQPRQRHFETLEPTNTHPMMYDDLRSRPLHATWCRSPIRDRPSSPYAFRRRRTNNRDRDEQMETPPAEDSSNAALIAAMDMPFEDVTNNPSRQILFNLRGILEHEIRAMAHSNRRLVPSEPPLSLRRINRTDRGRRREADRGDASTHLRNARRQDIIAAMVQITPMKENLHPQKRKTKLPHTKNQSQPHSRKNSLTKQNRPSQKDLAAQSSRTIRSQTTNNTSLEKSNYSMCSIDEASETLLVIQESDGTIENTDRESGDEVSVDRTRRFVEVNSLEDSLSILRFKKSSSSNQGTDSARKHDDEGDTPKNVPDSTNQPEQSKSSLGTSYSNSDHSSHNQICERRLSSLQRSIEKLEKEFLRATTTEDIKNTALQQLHRAWKRLSKHWEDVEKRQGIADGDIGESFTNYNEDRRILLLQQRELEERCRYNERKLARALKDASEANRKAAALEDEISLLRQQQEQQLQVWEERLEAALRENRLLAGAIERMSETE